MPRRTNDFQDLITLLTQIIGKDVAKPSVELPSKITGKKREVDIVVEGEVSGHRVLIGIECSAPKRRPNTVEWVERMYGKHSHLPTQKLVLVSSTGFTADALKLAAFHDIEAITPGEVTEGFVGKIVNNLKSLRLETLDAVIDTITVVVDPPIGGQVDRVPFTREQWALAIVRKDKTEVCALGQLANTLLRSLDLSRDEFRDIESGSPYEMAHGNLLDNGEPVFLHGHEPTAAASDGTDPGEPATEERLYRIVEIINTMTFQVRGVDMPLSHGSYRESNYSSGKAVVGDREFHWAFTESADGDVESATRISPIDDPMAGQFYRSDSTGKRMLPE
ncbi:hypothetical protein [Mycolicibacterium sp. XJ1904]